MDYPTEGPTHATFEPLEDLKNWQGSLLSVDLFHEPNDEEQKHEAWLEQKFSFTLNEYQEQSYLLDPFLEELVTPIVDSLKTYAKSAVADPTKSSSSIRVSRVSLLLYHYVKFRGYKTISQSLSGTSEHGLVETKEVRFFPHEVADLSIVLNFFQVPGGLVKSPEQWALRYVVLLWLYIICIIPFDLAQFDDPSQSGHTARSLQDIAKSYLNNPGLEREGAALLLSRLYMRKDTGIGFHDFVLWSREVLKDGKDAIMTVGVLQVLCEVIKSGSATQVQSEVAELLSIVRILQEDATVSVSTIVRKYRSKLVSRVGLRLLPGRPNARRKDVRTIAGGEESTNTDELPDFDVPTEVEDVLEHLFEALKDKDTIVRWSAAKGVARIAERLPKDFANQVLETILGFFGIHSIAAATLYDLPAIAEGTWHGACLACAEMARRSLIEPQYLPKLIEWLSKALYFDLRKGAHSIGSNVRDAAAYVLWALARTQDKVALVPHAEGLAQRLIAVALFDREVHIRRAASAAFQEHVGRTSLFPHGIDVLGKTDFYAVSIRRHAFLIAAPYVAQHAEYRRFLVNHLLDVVIRHWDITMRELAVHSLRLICIQDLVGLSRLVIEKSIHLLDSLDMIDIHGGLSALSEVAVAYKEGIEDPVLLDQCLHDVFTHLTRVPEKTFTTTRNEIVAAAACRLIANSITLMEINSTERTALPRWKRIVEIGLKHRHTSVQESAADAMARISQMKNGTPVLQQSLARLLGVVHWTAHLSVLPSAINYLVDKVQSSAVIETRRSCFQAMPRILTIVSDNFTSIISSDIANSLLDALINGLNDYTVDERGDVGSWIRIACMQGLTDIAILLFRVLILETQVRKIVELECYFPADKFQAIVAGVLKQGVEKLDNVRQEAGICFVRLLGLVLPDGDELNRWRLHGVKLLTELSPSAPGKQQGWNDANWLFPHAVRVLEIEIYRKQVLSGIVMSIGSKTGSTQKRVANSLVEFAQALPLVQSTGNAYSLLELVLDLINHAKGNLASNAIVVPTLQTFVVLFEGNSLRRLPTESMGMESLRTLMRITTSNIDKIKNIRRIHESMKIVVNLLIFAEMRNDIATLLPNFLAHMFPKVRADTAEYLYLLLQSADFGYETEGLEEILLETEWYADITVAYEAAGDVVEFFASHSV